MSSNRLFITLIFVFIVFQCSFAAYCHGKPGNYYTNKQPIWNEQPRLLRSHSHGKLYEIGDPSLNTSMKLLHVYGNMYQMGFAHGHLLKDQIKIFMPELMGYIQQQIQQSLPKKLPVFLQKLFAKSATAAVLDLTYHITKPWTNKNYYIQMQGIADASGIPFSTFRRFHMIGEVTKGACSMFGAWGNATDQGQTVQLRALDWDFDGPYRKYPLAVVYHPSQAKYGNSWMNIGFIGWIGVISGVNNQKMAISEIGVSFPDETFGKQSRIGNPFTFVLRDILQWDKNLNESIHRLKTTRRTCNLIFGVGDGKAGAFRGFQYSHSVCNVVDDTKPLPTNQTWHPAIQNTVYWGMDWNCPSFHQRLAQLLNKNHGKISAEKTIREILPSLNSGNLQAVIYDLTNEWVYFAYGHVTLEKAKIDAYKRPYIGLNLKQMFSEKLDV